jgi:prepilin-type N-terminal cleavage/methylation domain-containing protein
MMHIRSRSGFTLIELLVVIGIIALLATFVAPRILSAPKQAQRSACLQRLKDIYSHLIIYEDESGSLPRDSGPAFVLAIWKKSVLAPSEKNAEEFYCPSTGNKPPKDWTLLNDRSNLGASFEIDYAGRDQKDPEYRILKRTADGAEDTVIVCDVTRSNPKLRAHSNQGLCVLYAGGHTEFIPSDKFGPDEKVEIGAGSPVEKLKGVTNEASFDEEPK